MVGAGRVVVQEMCSPTVLVRGFSRGTKTSRFEPFACVLLEKALRPQQWKAMCCLLRLFGL